VTVAGYAAERMYLTAFKAAIVPSDMAVVILSSMGISR
jgi:hypothetical protein